MKLVTFALFAIALACVQGSNGGDPESQRVFIPHRMPERGVIPSFRILAGGEDIGRLRGDAILSNGRFFGIRWIAEAKQGWRAEVRDGDPNTLHVWTDKAVLLEPE